MIEIRNYAGEVISQSKNMRGIIDKNRKNPAIYLRIDEVVNGAKFWISWSNNDWSCVQFESYIVAENFAKSKKFATAEKSFSPFKGTK